MDFGCKLFTNGRLASEFWIDEKHHTVLLEGQSLRKSFKFLWSVFKRGNWWIQRLWQGDGSLKVGDKAHVEIYISRQGGKDQQLKLQEIGDIEVYQLEGHGWDEPQLNDKVVLETVGRGNDHLILARHWADRSQGRHFRYRNRVLLWNPTIWEVLQLLETNERKGHHHHSLHRQGNSNFISIQIDGVYKALGITSKKKDEVEEVI